jgi:hypothetical protein
MVPEKCGEMSEDRCMKEREPAGDVVSVSRKAIGFPYNL